MGVIGVSDGAFIGEIRNALTRVTGHDTKIINSLDDMNGVTGVLLSGGGDVDPARYGEGFSAMIWGMDKDRDELEFSLLDHCKTHEIPYMGICRGHQVVGVHAGMSLIPDISWNHTSSLGTKGPDSSPHHPIYGDLENIGLIVNSLHHQAVINDTDKLLEAGIEVMAIADNRKRDDRSIVEAMRGEGWVSCQWHPELDWGYVDISRRMFEMFGELIDG